LFDSAHLFVKLYLLLISPQATIHATYAGPIGYVRSALTMGLSQLAVFLKWISTPDDPPGMEGTSSNNSSPQRSRTNNLIR
jgi:hypothetical protein